MNTNVVIITGNLTKDVELSQTQGGTDIAKFRVAVNRPGDKGADFIPVTAWNGAALACAKYIGKGSKVAVTGLLRTSEYDAKDGSGRRWSFEVSASRVEFLSPRNGEQTEQYVPTAVAPSTDHPEDAPVGDVSEDDIPF